MSVEIVAVLLCACMVNKNIFAKIAVEQVFVNITKINALAKIVAALVCVSIKKKKDVVKIAVGLIYVHMEK